MPLQINRYLCSNSQQTKLIFTEPSVNSSKFQCWSKTWHISPWRIRQTCRDWRSHSPSLWRPAGSISHQIHTPLVPHYLPDRNRCLLGPGLRRPWNRGLSLDMPCHSGRGLLLGPRPAGVIQELLPLRLVCPSLWSSTSLHPLARSHSEEDTQGSRTWK